jgi:DNA (cytosine-5)-methyltransferase 1
MTRGSSSCHYSGNRDWTPRELSQFQSFPIAYDFVGTKTEVTKQIGDAFPPVMAEAMYRIIGKTLQAFDDGLIGVEDDLSDLDALLQERKAGRPIQSVSQRSIRNHRRANPATARLTTESTSAPSSSRAGNAFPSMDLLEGVLDGINQFPQRTAAASSRTILIEDDEDSSVIVLSDSDE